MGLKALQEKRNGLIAQARAILDKAKNDGGRGLTDGEARDYDNFNSEIDRLAYEIRIAEYEARHGGPAPLNLGSDEARALAYGGGIRGGGESRLFMPSWREYRALSEGTDSAGGYFVPEQAAQTFFDRLAAESVVLQAGPRVLGMDSDVLNVPKIGTSVTAAMTNENAEITASDLVFERVQLTARKAAGLTRASNECLLDSSPELRAVVEYDHTRQVSLLLDNQFLSGSGSAPNMRGIRNFSGVTATSLGANGATPTLDHVADAIQRLEADNAKATAIFCHPRTWNTLRKLADGNSRLQLQPDPTTEARKSLFGIPVHLSSQISIAETTGSNSDCSWIAVVDMSQVVIGRRSQVRISYASERFFEYDQTAIRTTSRWDIGCINEEAVELLTGVRA